MKSNIPTPHICAKEGDISKTVLMPGDPLRAKYIAENYLENPVCFNDVRGMLGFTGKFKGKGISVMGSGMGMASIGIYSYELFNFYNVENIIRIGSCGAICKETEMYSIILANAVHSMSSFLKVMQNKDDTVLYPSKILNEKIAQTAEKFNIPIVEAPINSSDVFYSLSSNHFDKFVKSSGCIAIEMEAFALFANAFAFGKNAACILTVSDNIETGQATTSKERENGFNNMMELALNAAYNF